MTYAAEPLRKITVQLDEGFSNRTTMLPRGRNNDNLHTICTLLIFAVLGILLNAAVVISYFRKRKKSAYGLLVAMASIDIFNCVVLSLEIARMSGILKFVGDDVWCSLHPYLVYAGSLTSAFIVVFRAFHRLMIVNSARSRVTVSYQSFKTVLAIIGFIIVVTSPYLVFRAFEIDSFCIENESANVKHNTFFAMKNNGKSKNRDLYFLTYYGTLTCCLFIGLILMVVTYVRILTLSVVRSSLKTDGITTKAKQPSVRFSNDLEIVSQLEGRFKDVENSSIGDYSNIDSENDDATSDGNNNSDVINSDKGDVCATRRNRKSVISSSSLRRTSTLSMMSNYEMGIPRRTVAMVIFALVTYLFYFPNFVLSIISIVYPTFKVLEGTEVNLIMDVFKRSYMFCLIFNPVLYSFLNRGFRRDFCRAIRCCSRRRRRSHHVTSNAGVGRTRSIIHIDRSELAPYKCTVRAELKHPAVVCHV